MRKLIAASLTLAVLVLPATASALTHHEAVAYGRAFSHVERALGLRTAGCKLIGPRASCHGRITDARVRRSTDVLYRMLAPPPRPRATVARAAPSYSYATTVTITSAPTSYSGGSGGGGGYCGVYQFDQSTWSSVGMSGSPCGASPAAQDHAAALLYAQRGSEPWPNCGRYAPNWSAVRQCENSGSYAP